VTATERMRQFTVEGAVLFARDRWRVGRLRPFLTGGAGYLRQLHEGDALAANGQLYGFGGGVKVPLLSRDRRASVIGLRADARAVIRTRGVAVDGASHVSPAVSVSAYVGFSR
jgi:hypothetical protein